jgi:hypothetical protein
MTKRPQDMSQQEIEAELRRRLKERWIDPAERRLLRKVFIVKRGIARYRKEQVEKMSVDQLFNGWAANPSSFDTLLDLSHVPDRQLIRTVTFQNTASGLTASRDLMADSAIAELAKRANAQRVTVADYIRKRRQGQRLTRPAGSNNDAG